MADRVKLTHGLVQKCQFSSPERVSALVAAVLFALSSLKGFGYAQSRLLGQNFEAEESRPLAPGCILIASR